MNTILSYKIIMKIKLLVLFALIVISSCGNPFKEISPASNPDSIKVKLEVIKGKSHEGKGEFTLKFINYGNRDIARCSIKIDNKYEHKFEGLINKTEDWSGKLETSLLENGKSLTFEFSVDIDNYTIIGITDNNYQFPKTIELSCLDGTVKWNL